MRHLSLGLLIGVLSLVALGACAEGRLAPAGVKPDGKDKTRPAKADKPNANLLNLEVTALQMLYHLQATPAQLKALANLADVTAQRPPRNAVKVSDKYRKTLVALRDALAESNDERIDELFEALDRLHEKEEPEFDEVEITEAARKHAPALLRRFGPRQVAVYVAGVADEFPDLAEKLTEALEQSRKLKGKEWTDLRDDVAYQVGWLVGGVDSAGEAKVRDQVTALLDRAHKLEAKDFKAQKAALEKEAQTLAARAGPTQVIRHFMERTLAELLSNPRLLAAVQLKQKTGR
jgi:hypothetical protein